MLKKYFPNSFLVIVAVLFILSMASCKKDKGSSTVTPTVATPTKIGLFEADSSIYKLLFIDVTKLGTQSLSSEYLVFDTGSGGMVIDAQGIIPANMITSSGFNFTGDSTVVNGITITKQTSTIEYGASASTTDKVYGNLAYAPVVIGNTSGSITVKRLPFFLYYKAVSASGTTYPSHDFDIMGVSPQYDLTFSNGAYITSPFSYFDPGTGLTKGFKMAALGTSHFSLDGNYVAGVVTLGLTASDLSSSSGFTMHQLSLSGSYGYDPVLPGSVTYGSKTLSSANVVFDTGTEPYSYLRDPSVSRATQLPTGTSVSTTTKAGFNWSYTTSSTENLTIVDPNATVNIFSLEFFLNNEYMVNFASHQLGVKND